MRLRDIKVGMMVRVKDNAVELTTSASTCYHVDSPYLKSLQGLTGEVRKIDSDKTIKIFIDDEYSAEWFDPIHLEAVTDEVVVTKVVTEPLTRKEELERIINESIANEAKARQELKLLNTTFSCEAIRNGEVMDGVYSISNTKSMCLVLNKVAFYISASTFEMPALLDGSWRSNTFTLTALKPSITFK